MSDDVRSVFDTSLVVASRGNGEYNIGADQPLLNFNSAFGGWALGVLLAAIEAEASDLAPLSSVNAVFLKAIPAAPMTVRVQLLRRGRQASFYRAELVLSEADALLVTADFVFSPLKDADISAKRVFPEVTPFEDAPILPSTPGPLWLKDFEQRIGAGQPFSAQERPSSAFWFSDPGGRPWDQRSILMVSDTPMPRTFFVDPMPRFGATVSYCLHVVSDIEAQAGDAGKPLLIEADSDSVSNGRFTQAAYIWSADGVLLAVSNQLAFY